MLVEGKTRALAHNFIAAEKDEDCMYAEVEELEDYVYGVTERRAQALVRTAQERFGEYAQYASRLSPDVELTVAEGGDPGYLADYIARIFRSMWQPSRKSSKSLALPAVW